MGATKAMVAQPALTVTQVPGTDLHLWLLADTGDCDPATRQSLETDPPYYGLVWPAAWLLHRWILEGTLSVAGRTVVDWGAGSGLVAMAAARKGAKIG